MSTDCSEAIEHLYHYLDEELSWFRRVRIRRHLRRCSHCFEAFGFEAELKRVIRTRAVTPPPQELIDGLRALIERERGAGPEEGRATRPR